jgi:hypothetical protein
MTTMLVQWLNINSSRVATVLEYLEEIFYRKYPAQIQVTQKNS